MTTGMAEAKLTSGVVKSLRTAVDIRIETSPAAWFVELLCAR